MTIFLEVKFFYYYYQLQNKVNTCFEIYIFKTYETVFEFKKFVVKMEIFYLVGINISC